MDLDFDDQCLDQAVPASRAGARFKPKGRLVPKKKQVSLSTSQPTTLATTTNVAKEKLESSVSETPGALSEENVDVTSRGINGSILRSCTKAVSEVAPAIHDAPPTQDSDTPATDGDIHAQTKEGECHVDMETLDIVQEEGTISSFVQHTGKFQPKPRVIEEPESHYSVDDNSYYEMGTNESELNEVQEELNIPPQVPTETAPEMEAQNASGEQVVSPSTNNTVEEEQAGRGNKKGKSKRAATRKRKTTSEEEPNKSSENVEKKKFKHASRRQKKRTLDKELLETPDEEIRFLPFRDMLRLVEYKEWLEKKEAKGAPVVPPTQESNTNASANQHDQYYSQDFDGEDDFAIEEGENQETDVVKPDSPVNYQTYMNKSSRSRWSKEDTELFYEGLQEFGSNLSMVQQLFPNRTREQIKLKFKLEERRHPLKVNDALSSRSKNLMHFQNVIKKLQQEAAAAKQAEEEDNQEQAGAEDTTDVPDNEEPSKAEETQGVGVKGSDGEDLENGVISDGGDEGDDDDFWNSYKSDM